jgi:hypoxanthine phosphoribosyltransferase
MELKIQDKTFVQFISAELIEQAVDQVAIKMNLELKDKCPLFIGLLNGAFVFAADLLKKLDFNCNISFVKLSSYKGTESTGSIEQQIGLKENIKDRCVVIIEDIVDTGTTLSYFINEIQTLKPSEIKIASMFYKPDACKCQIKIDYLGMEIPNDFVVGYGLDYNGFGRNYGELYKLKN